MSRSAIRRAILLVPVILGSCLLDLACSSPPVEQQVLTAFFRAARVRDNTTLASISAVGFDPRTEGSVQQFKIDSIGAQQHRTLQVQQLMDEDAQVRAMQVEFTKKMRDFYQSNSVAIDRAVKAQQAKQPVQGNDAALLAEWTKWDGDSRDFERKLSQARQKLSKERGTAVASLTPSGRDDIDVTGMDVDIITEPITVTAQVVSPTGETTPKTMVVTLQRASGKKDGQATEGRWIIMSIQPQGAAAPTS
jgi:hypothetical protein